MPMYSGFRQPVRRTWELVARIWKMMSSGSGVACRRSRRLVSPLVHADVRFWRDRCERRRLAELLVQVVLELA